MIMRPNPLMARTIGQALRDNVSSAHTVIVIAVMISATAVSVTSAAAATAGPGWAIRSLALPINFKSSDYLNSSERVAVNATEGTYELKLRTAGNSTGPISYNAGAAELQSGLEALASIGAGNVRVTRGPGNAGATQPYTVTFRGDLSGQSIPGLLEESENNLKRGSEEGSR